MLRLQRAYKDLQVHMRTYVHSPAVIWYATPWCVLLQDERDALADTSKRAQVCVCVCILALVHSVLMYCMVNLQEEKNNMESRMNALVVS